ncbi:MurR/RpiR family transcriptional regulator [Sporolactobacillus terrae]|uniref:MurR/RpiR family transcriptional regulator n=1 Tax=Sporolactobacillus terrae TaxID=269673 RepID=UPI00048F5E7D|nr:MurR/RpiR family transcriptional regulator [Sporolactobacillus terrae]
MDLEELINTNYHNLSVNDHYLLQYILNNKENIKKMSIQELSKASLSSTSSIVRLSKRLGFSGFSELKYHLKNEKKDEISPFKGYEESLSDDIGATLKTLKKTDLIPILKLIDTSCRIFSFGTGYGQKNILRELSRYFMTTNKQIIMIPGETELEMVSKSMNHSDVLIIVSLKGEVNELMEVLKILKLKNVSVISITNFSNNTLSSFTDYNLYYQTTEITKQNTFSRVSFVSLSVLFDYLFREYLDYKH